jgi:LPXTG-motif cell wall-anchored protein
MISQNSTTGYWPLFATTKANLYVDQTNNRWVKAYVSGVSIDPVACDMDEVIIGLRYKSHLESGRSSIDVSPLPDIQCAKLLVADINAMEVNSIDTTSVKVDSSGGAKVTTTQSVMEVKQCMLNKTSNFMIEQKGATFNTCYSHIGSTVVVSAPANVLLIEYLLSLKASRPRNRRQTEGPEILEFMIRREPIDADSLFGPDDGSSQTLRNQIDASKNNAVNKATAEYQANWGDKAKSIEQITEELGPTPWSSDKLVAGSAEFVSGSLMSGAPLQVIRGFTRSGDRSTPVSMICGNVIGCAHGDCRDEKCVCKPGFGGNACSERLDPCGDKPCGDRGICQEDYTKASNFNCTCDSGFSGDTCGITSNPCFNKSDSGRWEEVKCGHGECVATNDTKGPSYMCKCDPNWGQNDPQSRCDRRQTDCVGKWASSVCDSSCTQTETFHIIKEAEGLGKPCTANDGDTRLSVCMGGSCKKCMSRDCNGRGKCDEGVGSCVCDSGWTGENCELSTSACTTTLCNGHGNCNDSQTECTCMNGWTSDPSATKKFCTNDPCDGCPSGQCNTYTGYCSCDGPDPDNPKCGNIGAVDCEGKWSDWGSCSATCEKKRYYSVVSLPSGGGKACPKKAGEAEVAACTTGSCCNIKPTECMNGAEYIAASCECRCPAGFQGRVCDQSSSTADKVITKEVEVDAKTRALFNTTERPTIEYETQVAQSAETTPPPATGSTNMLYVYIGAGAGGLLLIGGLVWLFKKKKPAPVDPLLAGMEGLEGMDLTGMDLSALGLDANGNPISTDNTNSNPL